ncbi:MAG: transglutaminase family protein [Rhodobacteraceae bacterium]|nr:MAG: transglutaminase family protein [Paracoccaceae bacterium]
MIYAVRHTTRYQYAEPVTLSTHRLRVTPRETPLQRLRRFALDVAPDLCDLTAERDSFGNAAHLLEIRESHESLVVEARSEVALTAPTPTLDRTPWEDVAAAVARPRGPEALDAAAFAFPSRFTGADDALEDYVRESFRPGRPMLDAARELTTRLNADLAYDPAATHAGTTAAEAFGLRAGVCQDFAHVFLACLRALGLPARYVSGYLLTRPPEGRPRLVGADASHAWASVWSPLAGWRDFDPTNDATPALEHVTCAWGRDYGDVGPIIGVVLGGGAHALSVEVDVAPLGAE